MGVIFDPKEELILEEICSLFDGFENKRHAIAAALRIAIGIGCKEQAKKGDKSCIGCPLVSYVCREIHTRANDLLRTEEVEMKELMAQRRECKREMFKHPSDSEEYRVAKTKADDLKKEINRLYGENDDFKEATKNE